MRIPCRGEEQRIAIMQRGIWFTQQQKMLYPMAQLPILPRANADSVLSHHGHPVTIASGGTPCASRAHEKGLVIIPVCVGGSCPSDGAPSGVYKTVAESL